MKKVRENRGSGSTVEQLLTYACPTGVRAIWPPDVFAVVALLLEKSGAYTKAIEFSWPPVSSKQPSKRQEEAREWAGRIRRLGREWRDAAGADKNPPLEVVRWWNHIVKARHVPVRDIPQQHSIYESLLHLCAVADEACAGVGVANRQDSSARLDRFDIRATQLLTAKATLCSDIDSTLLRVLPKLHTPQVGMTLHSLTHHLALCRSGDIVPEWYKYPSATTNPRSLNLLLAPWPIAIHPRDFRPVDVPADYNMDRQLFGFFSFAPERRSLDVVRHTLRLFEAASKVVGRIDAVILPEGALGERQHSALKREITRKRHAMLIAGVTEVGRPGKIGNQFGDNYCTLDAPFVSTGDEQHKHHRWRLDKPQILQYGLGSSLDPEKCWWEHIGVRDRKIRFVSIYEWLTLCVLICEDLARQDPVAELVRSVGPNLVIALLMDGPQLLKRWSSRYAMVLADDPGSSVLTLTSLGMASLCRPPDVRSSSRCIALWKDAKTGGPYEIELPPDADAAVLSLAVEEHTEWTADGRNDETDSGEGGTGYPILAGVHFISERNGALSATSRRFRD
jgi:hypothetical protein